MVEGRWGGGEASNIRGGGDSITLTVVCLSQAPSEARHAKPRKQKSKYVENKCSVWSVQIYIQKYSRHKKDSF